MTNYIWLISQSAVSGHDTYDSAVVIAPNEEAAKRIHPSKYFKGWDEDHKQWYHECSNGKRHLYESDYPTWSKPGNVIAVNIGKANSHHKAGEIICSSFNAG